MHVYYIIYIHKKQNNYSTHVLRTLAYPTVHITVIVFEIH